MYRCPSAVDSFILHVSVFSVNKSYWNFLSQHVIHIFTYRSSSLVLTATWDSVGSTRYVYPTWPMNIGLGSTPCSFVIVALLKQRFLILIQLNESRFYGSCFLCLLKASFSAQGHEESLLSVFLKITVSFTRLHAPSSISVNFCDLVPLGSSLETGLVPESEVVLV